MPTLSDGTMQPCGAPLSKRMRAGESLEVTAHRTIQEELASVLKVDDVKEKVQIVEGTCKRKVYEMQSRAYPGLRSRCVMHTVDAYVEGLSERNFSTETEEFGDCNDELKAAAEKALRVKRTFWVWRWASIPNILILYSSIRSLHFYLLGTPHYISSLGFLLNSE